MKVKKLKIINVVGARPNYMKVAPLYDIMHGDHAFDPFVVHTGQHYDHAMSDLFFNQLGLPEPHHYLGVGSAPHGEQTGKIMIAFERVVDQLRPDIVVVVGDVNSTIGCGLVAVKRGIRVAHVEAGLRSFDRSMPEEINRVLTDQISDYLFTTEVSAAQNLTAEGVCEEKIFFVGNVMIDSLLKHRGKAAKSTILSDLGLSPRGFALITLHRPSNVDDREILLGLLNALGRLSEKLPVLFPVHPRTHDRLADFGIRKHLASYKDLLLTAPLGYLEFLHCMDNARFVITDSGGIQEETTVLGVPCITVRDNTERPVTVAQGTNVVVGRNTGRMLEEASAILKGKVKTGGCPELWDGRAAERIVRILKEREHGRDQNDRRFPGQPPLSGTLQSARET